MSARLGEGFEQILTTYGAKPANAPLSKSDAFIQALERLQRDLTRCDPVTNRSTLRVKWSAGVGRKSYIPWIAFLDSRETTAVFMRDDQRTGSRSG